jgi:hypothetical protein
MEMELVLMRQTEQSGRSNDMKNCQNSPTCNANICPLDPDIEKRSWFIGEDVCIRKDFAAIPMIRRQKQLNRKKPREYLDKPLYAEWLTCTAPKKRVLSQEHRSALAENMRRINRAKLPDPESHSIE